MVRCLAVAVGSQAQRANLGMCQLGAVPAMCSNREVKTDAKYLPTLRWAKFGSLSTMPRMGLQCSPSRTSGSFVYSPPLIIQLLLSLLNVTSIGYEQMRMVAVFCGTS